MSRRVLFHRPLSVMRRCPGGRHVGSLGLSGARVVGPRIHKTRSPLVCTKGRKTRAAATCARKLGAGKQSPPASTSPHLLEASGATCPALEGT